MRISNLIKRVDDLEKDIRYLRNRVTLLERDVFRLDQKPLFKKGDKVCIISVDGRQNGCYIYGDAFITRRDGDLIYEYNVKYGHLVTTKYEDQIYLDPEPDKLDYIPQGNTEK